MDAFVGGVRHWRDKDKIEDSPAEELIDSAELILKDILADGQDGLSTMV